MAEQAPDGGFVVDAPYLRQAARELTQALAVAQDIRNRAQTERGNGPAGWIEKAGPIQVGQQIDAILELAGSHMNALVAKGEAVAIALLSAADRYDLAEAEIAAKLKAGEAVPPMLRAPIEQQLSDQQKADLEKLNPTAVPQNPTATPPPFDMTTTPPPFDMSK